MTTSTRDISLDAVRDAAKFVYHAAIRTPLVRVDAPGAPDGDRGQAAKPTAEGAA